MSSPVKKTPSKGGDPAFSARELELLGKALQANENDVKINYAKFAELGGFKNANSAKASWHKLKEKFERARGETKGEVANGAAADSKTSDEDENATETPKTPASKKRKAAAKDENGDDTPGKSAKKPRKAAAKKKATAGADEEESKEVVKNGDSAGEADVEVAEKGGEGEDTPKKSAKKPRKPAAKKAKKATAAADDEEKTTEDVKKEDIGIEADAESGEKVAEKEVKKEADGSEAEAQNGEKGGEKDIEKGDDKEVGEKAGEEAGDKQGEKVVDKEDGEEKAEAVQEGSEEA